MAWLSIQQDLNDIVRFVHSDNPEEVEAIGFDNFVNYVNTNSRVINYLDFIKQVNTFFPILLNLDTGEWEIFQIEQEEVSHRELLELNRTTEEEHTFSHRLREAKKKNTFVKTNDCRNRHRTF